MPLDNPHQVRVGNLKYIEFVDNMNYRFGTHFRPQTPRSDHLIEFYQERDVEKRVVLMMKELLTNFENGS